MMLEASWEMWNDHKLTGVGPGKWGEYYYSPKYHPKDGHEKDIPCRMICLCFS